MKNKKPIRLSASKLNTFSKCSWVYFCTYILKVRSASFDGTDRGSICHYVFENLLKSKRKHLVDKILAAKTIKAAPSVARYVDKLIAKFKLKELDKKVNNKNLIDEMIYVGLSLDFYCKEWDLLPPELEFNYQGKGYELVGFIDKAAKKDNQIKFLDYKSSKAKYSGEEEEFNIQSLIYSLWAYRELGMIPFVQFIFLRFKDDPFINKQYTEEQLLGFEEYLSYITKFLTDFTFDKAISGLAADKGFPKDGGFGGRTMCGRATYAGELKKDKTPMFHCYYKFPFNYFAVFNDKGEHLYSSRDEPKLNEGETAIEQEYKGCFHFNRENYREELKTT